MSPKTQSHQVPHSSGGLDYESASDNENDEPFLDEEGGFTVDGIYIPPAQAPALTVDPTGPRLLITKIENKFFKSYAHQTILGPFHKCFNSIVGPNGSGKSNVIDSMLFVFGYRATKIRCKKVSVLIHNSEHYQNVQSCSVTIHFALIVDRAGDEYDVVPGSEFVVTRIANKDNSSYYELNGRRVQFKEVGMLLKKHGIDLDHNRFLILQGEVEQIAMMKCKGDKDGESGMLEYLEDVIGTSRYKKPLELLNDRVETLSQSRTEKINRLRLVEQEMETIKEPMEEAVKFLTVENNITKSKNIIYQKNIKEVEAKLQEDQADRANVYETQKLFIDKLEEMGQRKAALLGIQDQEASEYENLKKSKESFKESIDKMAKQDLQLEQDMQNMVKSRKKMKEKVAQEKNKLRKFETLPEENQKKIEELDGMIKKSTIQKEKLELEKGVLMQSIQKDTQHLQVRKEDLLKELAVLKEAEQAAKAALTLAETELNICTSTEDSEKNKLQRLKQTHETLVATIEERSKQVAELKKTIPLMEKQLEKSNTELVKIKTEETGLFDSLRTKRTQLEENRSSMQANSSRNRVLTSLLAAKNEGQCPGLFGRLGDLGAIDAKYDVAISTACGPLDNIVVDTVETAQWCIEFLKKHDIGRAVFIALDKQEHLRQQANSSIRTPENVPRLYDLVGVKDDRVKTAFYYALRDTLVADDLDQASRIAYGATRYRVVTLKGDLIETSGTMSGGGKSVLKGRMGQSVATQINPAELEKLDKSVQEMEIRIRHARERQGALETEIVDFRRSLDEKRVNLEKFDRELKSVQQQLPQIVRQVKEQEARTGTVKSDKNKVEKLTRVVEQRREEFERAAEASGELQEQVGRVTEEINEKSGNKIKGVEKKIKECTKSTETWKTEIVRLNVAVKNAERDLKSTEEDVARMEREIEDMENNLRRMKQEREDITTKVCELRDKAEEVVEELEDKEKRFAIARKEVAKITDEETQLKSEKIDIDEKVKEWDKKIRDCTATVASLTAKLNQLHAVNLHDIPGVIPEVLKRYTDEELLELDTKRAQSELQTAENYLKTAKPNLNIIEEYRKKQDIFKSRSKAVEEITLKRTEMRNLYGSLRTRRKNEFITGFNIIKMKLKELYQMITLGGDADLEMVDTYDPFAEGIQFCVRPLRKTWKKIANLSGGEKTLSSLALVFALHYYKPSPLYVMDEIDAALDFKNVSIVGKYIKERTKNTQFIIISLRTNMFELADSLVGIYKTFNTTKSITMNPALYQVLFNGGDQPNVEMVVAQVHQATADETTHSESNESMLVTSSAGDADGNEDIEIPATP